MKMKKKISAVLIIVLMVSSIFTVIPAFAYTGGLLDGQVMNLGKYAGVTNNTTTKLTDNDNTTGSILSATSGSESTAWYHFSSPQTISAIQLDTDSYNMEIRLYDSNTYYLSSYTTTNNNKFTITSVANVSYVAILNMDNSNYHTIYEFDVFSSSSDTTPPAAPTGLTATSGDGTAALTWTANTESDLAGYNVYQDGVKINTSLITGTSNTLTGLTNGTTYNFSITTVDTSGNESVQSSSVSVTPNPALSVPTNLTASAGDTQVSLSWSAVSGATGYNVKRSTTTGGPYTTVTSSVYNSYTDSSVTNGTTYYYVVSAVNAGGESGNSNEVSATPQVAVPAAPTNLTATAGDSQVSLSWTASDTATSYNVKRASSTGGPYTSIANGITGTSYVDSTAVNGTTYYYVVSAVNAGGES